MLIALLSVFVLNVITSILVFAGVLTTISSLPVFDIFTVEMLPGFVKDSVVWLAVVGVLWGGRALARLSARICACGHWGWRVCWVNGAFQWHTY
ncbi:MAG TPA: hypothetical protein EYG79_00615 [Rhodobacteraceae bacterium]|nr:hypothetical protein [Paracoccaceae bacterium]